MPIRFCFQIFNFIFCNPHFYGDTSRQHYLLWFISTITSWWSVGCQLLTCWMHFKIFSCMFVRILGNPRPKTSPPKTNLRCGKFCVRILGHAVNCLTRDPWLEIRWRPFFRCPLWLPRQQSACFRWSGKCVNSRHPFCSPGEKWRLRFLVSIYTAVAYVSVNGSKLY